MIESCEWLRMIEVIVECTTWMDTISLVGIPDHYHVFNITEPELAAEQGSRCAIGGLPLQELNVLHY